TRPSRCLPTRRSSDLEGIQIVIPAFQAGDEHAILLDVVAESAGPVAEVTVRYKDLVSLGNGTARASLALEARRDAPGPLAHHVRSEEHTSELQSPDHL